MIGRTRAGLLAGFLALGGCNRLLGLDDDVLDPALAQAGSAGSAGASAGAAGSGGAAECEAGQTRCSGKALEVCVGAGQWQTKETCGIGCDGGCLTVDSIAAGTTHTCVVLSNRTVRCWGDAKWAALGDGEISDSDAFKPPVAVKGLTGVKKLAAGATHVCALGLDGAVRCWGYNQLAEVGDGTTDRRPAPAAKPVFEGASDVAASPWHSSCAIRASDGAVFCWGYQLNGQFQNGDSDAGTYDSTPTQVPGVTGATSLGLSSYTGCAVVAKGTSVVCWGRSPLGDGTGKNSSEPAPIASSVTGWTSLAGGDLCLYALAAGGTRSFGWGDFGEGTLGNGKDAPSAVPEETTSVLRFDGASILSIRGGFRHGCALVDTGKRRRARCFGRNAAGQVGASSPGVYLLPFDVDTGPTDVVTMEAGWAHSCAVDNGGQRVVCWGDNELGQLGVGVSPSYSATPLPVPF